LLLLRVDIRHPEELSLSKPLEAYHLKHNMKEMQYNGGQTPSADTNSFSVNNHSPAGSTGSLDMTSSSPFICAPLKHHSTPISSPVSVSIVLYLPQSAASLFGIFDFVFFFYRFIAKRYLEKRIQ
jgi:hypothetical protein